jgi:hypothetical protein
MRTIEAVNEAQILLIKAVGGNLDPKEITIGLFNTLTDAALKWAMVEERMAPRKKEQIKSGRMYWVRPKYRARWEPARYERNSQCDDMFYMLDGVEFVNEEFMRNWVIGPEIVEPPEDS